ncbi:MAG: hypothetical protein EOP06_03100 [Proteobacteria bacterium]|nr:MAG: hypothetical protein EOP06_03100 [Pseudomonadota bacterium]
MGFKRDITLIKPEELDQSIEAAMYHGQILESRSAHSSELIFSGFKVMQPNNFADISDGALIMPEAFGYLSKIDKPMAVRLLARKYSTWGEYSEEEETLRFERIQKLHDSDELSPVVMIDGIAGDGWHRAVYAHAIGVSLLVAEFTLP